VHELRQAQSLFFFSSRRRHTIFSRDWSSDVCSSDVGAGGVMQLADGKIFAMRYIEIDEMEDLIEKDEFGGMSQELITLAKGYIRDRRSVVKGKSKAAIASRT